MNKIERNEFEITCRFVMILFYTKKKLRCTELHELHV